MELLQYGWEIFVNVIEAILYFYLLFKNDSCYPKSKQLVFAGFLLRVVFISCINFSPFLSPYSLIGLLLYDISFVCTCFYGNFPKKLITGCSYILVAIVADKITYEIVSLFTSCNLSELSVPGPVRFQMTLVYLLICSVFIFCLSRRKKNKDLFLSPQIQLIMLAFILFAIIISDQLLGMTIDISNHTIPKNALLLLSFSGLFILLLIFSFILLIERLGYLSKRNLEFMQIQEQEKAERQHYQLTEQYMQTLRYWKHDYENHLSVISELNHTENYDKLADYITQLTKETKETMCLVSTGNSILDAIVSTKLLLAEKHNIFFSYQIYLPEKDLPLPDVQFASLLNNLFDNSIEACTHLEPDGSPYITLEIKPYQNMFYLKIQNSSDGKYCYDRKGNLKTRKSPIEHGLGLKRMMQIVTNAGGFIRLEPQNTSFTATILLPLKSAKKKKGESNHEHTYRNYRR